MTIKNIAIAGILILVGAGGFALADARFNVISAIQSYTFRAKFGERRIRVDLYTTEIRGHKYIITQNGNIIHAAHCDCQSANQLR